MLLEALKSLESLKPLTFYFLLVATVLWMCASAIYLKYEFCKKPKQWFKIFVLVAVIIFVIFSAYNGCLEWANSVDLLIED